jgi:hypothetical protein
MTDLRKHPLPYRSGNVTWEQLDVVMREILARQDARNPRNDFAGAFVAHANGSATIGDVASVTSQKTLPIVNTGNRLSAQNANPLTSTGNASTSQIQISAHTVTYGFGVVSYGSGSITGLTPLQTYFVYAADPTYAGGSVSYTATTSATTVVSNRGYYYVGSIQTANSTPAGTVTAATSASPIVITVTAHGFSTGNTVAFTGMPDDFAVLDSGTHTITVLSADTFSVPVDGSAFLAYTSGGTATRVSTPTGGYGNGGGWAWNGDIP